MAKSLDTALDLFLEIIFTQKQPKLYIPFLFDNFIYCAIYLQTDKNVQINSFLMY